MPTWKWYVYIIRCKDESYYVGLTWNLSQRYEQHKLGKGSAYTAKHGVAAIVYAEEFENLDEARLRERQIHGWTREKKEKLIKGTWGKW